MGEAARSFSVVDAAELPIYPHDGLRMESHYWVQWHHARWLNSEAHLVADYEVQGVMRALYDIAQMQYPTGTLPDDDVQLSRLLRLDLVKWRALRRMDFGPLRGWVPCLCGDRVRLMHPVVTEVVGLAVEQRERREIANNEKATAQRLKRLRDGLRALGLSDRVLADDVLVDRIDGWLLEHCPGQRRQPTYARALDHAQHAGWF